MSDLVRSETVLKWANDRGAVLSEAYYEEIEKAARSTAFSVSWIEKISQVEAILLSLKDALATGLSFSEWKAGNPAELASMADWHTEVVYRNFINTAAHAGMWDRIYGLNEDSENRKPPRRPYILYSAIMDGRQSDFCGQMNGLIRRYDDPIWLTHSPLNHHNCRSTLITLSEDQAKRRSGPTSGMNQDLPTDEQGNPLGPAEGWDYNPRDAVVAMRKLLVDRNRQMASISADLAIFIEQQVAKLIQDGEIEA